MECWNIYFKPPKFKKNKRRRQHSKEQTQNRLNVVTYVAQAFFFNTWGCEEWIYSSITPMRANPTHLTLSDRNSPLSSVGLKLSFPKRNTSTFSYLEVIFTKYIKKNIGLRALAYSTVQQLSVNISPMIIVLKVNHRVKIAGTWQGATRTTWPPELGCSQL